MSGSELQRFQHLLQDMRAQLTAALKDSLDRLVIAQRPGDSQADSQLAGMLMAELRKLDAAQQAIHEGAFGLCAMCGGEISIKRLELMPWTTCCPACREEADARRGVVRRAASRDYQRAS